MGADIEETPVDATAPTAATATSASRSPTSGSARRRSTAIDLGPADVAAAIDEIPVLCLAAARGRAARRRSAAPASSATRSPTGSPASPTGSPRSARDVDVDGDDLRITGGRALAGTTVDSLDDHRLAMTFAIAGLIARGRTTVLRPASAAISYPGFFDDLGRVTS